MSTGESGLYTGTVMHHRLRPRTHRLAYRIFSFLLDLDEIDSLARRLTFFSRNRFNLFSFHDRDYGAGSKVPLRDQIQEHMEAAGIALDGGPIRLLTMPRILGYAFNPISVYFCYNRNGTLIAIFYEVSNTFGERHSYLMPVTGDAGDPIRQQCPKRFHVSPFLDMAMTYTFRVVPPAKHVEISIAARGAEGLTIVAVLSANRVALTDAALVRVFILYPLLTLKVIVGIHWEALLIWCKGVRLRKRPPPPDEPVTIADAPIS